MTSPTMCEGSVFTRFPARGRPVVPQGVVTLSTIGYGDLTPGREPGSRVVVGILVLVGVPFFGMMLARIVEIAYGRAK